MRNYRSTRPYRGAGLVLGVSLLVPHVCEAEAFTNYHVQVLAQLAQPAGDFTPRNFFALGQLNESGHLVFVTGQPNLRQALVQLSNGKISVIALGGSPGPDGRPWPTDMSFYLPISMNEAGNVAFVPDSSSGIIGVYQWEASTQTVTPIAVKGMSAVNDLVFEGGGNHGGATINNHDAVSFVGFIKTPSNQKRGGVFVRRRDGELLGVAVPGDPLPGEARAVLDTGGNSINDAGLVAFDAIGTQSPSLVRAYLWQNGVIKVIAEAGTDIPGFGRVRGANALGINKDNRVMMSAWLKDGGPVGLFLWNDGAFVPVAVPGQEMPGGGRYMGSGFEWGFANQAGQYAFITRVDDKGVTRSAAYQVGTDGNVSLIAKSGMTIDLGTISQIGSENSRGIGLNSRGQVALVAKLDRGRDTVLLLTPKSP